MRRIAAVAFMIVGTTAAWAQEPVRITRIQEPIRLDGRLDEGAWSQATSLPLERLRPTAGGAPSAPSEVLIAYDDTYLYAAARFAGDAPADVRAGSLTRDRLSGDNEFRILLDTFNDEQNGLEFIVNPAGTRVDRAVLNDARSINASWDSFWDAATHVDGHSWSAELRIPFSSLRFQPRDGRVVMGVIASRYRAVNNELSTFPVLPATDLAPDQRPLRAAKIEMAGVEAQAPMYFSPYVLTGRQRQHVLNADRTAFAPNEQSQLEGGADLKYRLASNLTLDLTVNTDFAQVEADNQQVNLSRFSLFFPEKRQFFQEQSGIFDFGLGQNSSDRVFHTRRIGLASDGSALRIYGGARVVGRAGEWDVGALSMQTEAEAGDGTENMTVLRARRTVLNPSSYLGGMVTSRLAADGPGNVVYATDAQYRAPGDNYLRVSWAQSFDTRVAESGLDNAVLLASIQHFANTGLFYTGSFKWQGPSFEPALGFLTLRDYYQFAGNVRYGWQPRGGVIENLQPSLNVSRAYDNNSSRLVNGNATLFLNWRMNNGVGGFFHANQSDDTLSSNLTLGANAFAPAGRHQWRRVGAAFFGSNGWRFRPFLNFALGSFYDGNMTTAGIGQTVNLNRHLELGLEYNYTHVEFPDRNQVLDADIARVRVNAALNARLSAATFLQYNEAARQWAVNARVRWHAAEGRDLWIVLNDQLNTDRERDPLLTLPRSQSNTIALKYTHTLLR